MSTIPLETPVQIVNNVTLASGASATLATFQLPKAATSYSLQTQVHEARGTPGDSITFNVNFGLDGTNYPWGATTQVNYITSPWWFTMNSTPSTAPIYYVQVTATNGDSISHTFDNVWVLFK